MIAVLVLLVEKQQKRALAHPHGYDWHDPPLSLKDKDAKKKRIGFWVKENTQVAKASSSTHYADIAKHFGKVKPGATSDLKHYDYRPEHLAKIHTLIKEHGFTHYYAGGKHGKPDLATKNYNTGHLMIYDPSSGSGGDFKHHSYTDAWRKVHELAHALTYKHLNSIYGEGRRLGKLGVRTSREAMRAVHWEWLAAHKQRELSAKIGVHISDEHFAREVNTVMHDGVHRAVTGKFAEPADEGFHPSSAKMPLHHSLRIVAHHAQRLGLRHGDQTSKEKAAAERPMFGTT